MVVRIWDAQTGNLVERLRGRNQSVTSLAFTPDGCGLVSGECDGSTKYWDILPMINARDSGKRIGQRRALMQHDANVRDAARILQGKTEGWGEMGSTCISSTGQEVYHVS